MKKSKKMFLVLVLFLIILLGFTGIIATKIESYNVYEEAQHISNYEFYDDTQGVNYYYYYSETCTYCIEIKPEINNFYKYISDSQSSLDIDFYLIDIDQNPNVFDEEYAKIGTEEQMIEYIGNLDFPVIAGTPTLIETTNGKITNVKVGATDIPAYLEYQYNY